MTAWKFEEIRPLMLRRIHVFTMPSFSDQGDNRGPAAPAAELHPSISAAQEISTLHHRKNYLPLGSSSATSTALKFPLLEGVISIGTNGRAGTGAPSLP